MHLGPPWSQRSFLPCIGEPTTGTLMTGPTPVPIHEMREPTRSMNHMLPSTTSTMPRGVAVAVGTRNSVLVPSPKVDRRQCLCAWPFTTHF